MKKVNSLIYLFYHLLLWVVLPSTALGEKVFAGEYSVRGSHSITKGDFNFSDFQHAVNPEWNKIGRQNSAKDWLRDTGHWLELFTFNSGKDFQVFFKESFQKKFSNLPIFGALTISKIIFPFHYFW